MTRYPVNIERIISGDMDDMAQSTMKKSMGHAFLMLLLCKKSKVEDFIYGHMMYLARALDVAWINGHPRKHIPKGLPLANEDSQAHKDKINMIFFMHNFYAHTGLPRCYLTHQVDTWTTTQCFRDCFSEDPSTPFYGRYQYLRIETPIQLGGPVQRPSWQSPFSQHTPQHHQGPFMSPGQREKSQSEQMSPIYAFMHHGGDLTDMINFDQHMKDMGIEDKD
ncbi:hypothetical protein KIW84_014588 [Lathyrus oleraceus]|uniref:Uncharacterized protein n=1 Tax=Pisum sativum TaxID=3888 RepID=A0A9D5BNU6_PEA|nr:hypothetical protein KIW84_014588 [Pisum sativum]